MRRHYDAITKQVATLDEVERAYRAKELSKYRATGMTKLEALARLMQLCSEAGVPVPELSGPRLYCGHVRVRGPPPFLHRRSRLKRNPVWVYEKRGMWVAKTYY